MNLESLISNKENIPPFAGLGKPSVQSFNPQDPPQPLNSLSSLNSLRRERRAQLKSGEFKTAVHFEGTRQKLQALEKRWGRPNLPIKQHKSSRSMRYTRQNNIDSLIKSSKRQRLPFILT